MDKHICYHTINELYDDNVLLPLYLEQKSLQKKINKLKSILLKHNLSNKLINDIIDDYVINLIPAGLKGVIRGNLFNEIVKNRIIDLNLDCEIKFEEKHPVIETDEIPDFYIQKDDKIIIGMNQLDLWGGGAQSNRGSKYIYNKINSDNCKLLSVVLNDPKLKGNKSKKYKLVKFGIENNRLCWLNNLVQLLETL